MFGGFGAWFILFISDLKERCGRMLFLKVEDLKIDGSYIKGPKD